MKKLFTLLLTLTAYTCLAQNDVSRTKPVIGSPASASYNKSSVVDANLKAKLTLYIPNGSAPTLNNAKDSTGAVYFKVNAASDTSFYIRTGGAWLRFPNYNSVLALLTTKFDKVNGLISTGGITLAGSTVTVAPSIVSYINGVTYTKQTGSSFIITSATAGFYRKDLIYATTAGTVLLLQGTENASIAVEPTLPVNSVKVAVVDVFGSTITQPEPILTDYLTKAEANTTFIKNQTAAVQSAGFKIGGNGSIGGVATITGETIMSNHARIALDLFMQPGRAIQLADGRSAIIGTFNGVEYRLGNNDDVTIPDYSKTFKFRNRGLNYLTMGSLSVDGGGQSALLKHYADFTADVSVTGKLTVSQAPVSPTDVVRLQDLPASGGFVTLTGTQTLTNKTLTSPVINTPTGIVKADIGGINNIDNTSDLNKPISTAAQSALNLKINLSEKGAINGVATLDAGGKVPTTQLPVGAQVYKGSWNAATNTPTLSDATGTAGWTYRVTVAGSQNLGSGIIAYSVGDDVIHNGTIYQRNPSAASVTTVNGQSGTVVLTSTNIDEGLKLYYTEARVSANANVLNGQTAFTWGDHALQRYFKYENVAFGVDANTLPAGRSQYTNAINAPFSGPITRFDSNGYDLYLNAGWQLGSQFAFRVRNGDTGALNPWHVIYHTGNLTPSIPSTVNTVALRSAEGDITARIFKSEFSITQPLPTTGFIMGQINQTNDNFVRPHSQAQVRDFLGLGTNAYSSVAFAPLSGANFTGALTASNFSGSSSGINTGNQDLSGYAPLASPSLTGTPTAPTAASGTNTTQLATTAFVRASVPTNTTQLVNGSGYLTANSGFLENGVYTPVITIEGGASSVTPVVTHYFRVGNQVTVSGSFNAISTGSGALSFLVSLPIPSNLIYSYDLTGHGQLNSVTPQTVVCFGNPSNNKATVAIGSNTAGSPAIYFSFTYTVTAV